MKTVNLLLLTGWLLIGLSSSALAGEYTASGLRFGTTTTFIRGKTFEVPATGWFSTSLEPKPGIAVSAFATYNFNERWAIQPEVNLKANMFQQTWKMKGGDIKHSYTMYFLSMPFLGKFVIVPETNVLPAVYFGPEFGLMVGNSVKVSYYDTRLPDKSYDFENRRVFDFALNMGTDGGWTISESMRFFYDVRFTISLLDFIDKVDPYYYYKKGNEPTAPWSPVDAGDLRHAAVGKGTVLIHTYDGNYKETAPEAKAMGLVVTLGFSF